MFITHKYTQTSSLQWTTPNANIVYWNFGVNCLYDPYLSVGGTQPCTLTNWLLSIRITP